MANDNAYSVAKKGDKYRVMRGGQVQSSLDNGGFKDRQSALDVAMKANRKRNQSGTGYADEAADKMQNRQNQVESAVEKMVK